MVKVSALQSVQFFNKKFNNNLTPDSLPIICWQVKQAGWPSTGQLLSFDIPLQGLVSSLGRRNSGSEYSVLEKQCAFSLPLHHTKLLLYVFLVQINKEL